MERDMLQADARQTNYVEGPDFSVTVEGGRLSWDTHTALALVVALALLVLVGARLRPLLVIE